jgi:hypothetical protein
MQLEDIYAAATSEQNHQGIRKTIISIDGLVHLDHDLVFDVYGCDKWIPISLGSILNNNAEINSLLISDSASLLFSTVDNRQEKNLIKIKLGKKLSLGVVCNSVIIKGAIGTAGELSHLKIEQEGSLCFCGKRGCLETMSATKQWHYISTQIFSKLKDKYSPEILIIDCNDQNIELPNELNGVPVITTTPDEESTIRGASYVAAIVILRDEFP